MRTLKISLLVFILSITVSAQWFWQNGLPPQQNTLKILFLDSNTVFAVGDKGLIMKSIDGGLNWNLQISNTELMLQDICFINKETGFVIGNDGIILKTSDSGLNWIGKEVEPKINLKAIHVLDVNNAWACGENGLIIHTQDGGESWKTQNSGMTSMISDIHFSNLLDGCATGYDGFFLHTSNGGNIWESVYSIGEKIRAMDFINDNTGYAVSTSYYPPWLARNNFWKTTNGGETWNHWGIGITSFTIKDIVFISDLIGFGVDYDGSIFKTENSVEWEQVFCCLWPNNFNSISFYNNNRGIAVSSSGQMSLYIKYRR